MTGEMYQLPRWRTLLARWLLTSKFRLSECSKHYDEYGMPTSNLVGCIWCALEEADRQVRVLGERLIRYVRQYGPEPSAAERCPICKGSGKKPDLALITKYRKKILDEWSRTGVFPKELSLEAVPWLEFHDALLAHFEAYGSSFNKPGEKAYHAALDGIKARHFLFMGIPVTLRGDS